MRRFLASSLVLCALAHAQPRAMAPAAREHLERGMEYFTARDFTAAISAFDRGLAIDAHPDFHYAKAQALRLGGDCRAALVSYRTFLATNPPETEAALARENVTKCEQLLAATKVDEPKSPPPPPPPPPPSVERWREVPPPTWWRDPPGVVVASVGVASLATATVFALRARSHATSSGSAADLDEWYADRDRWRRDSIISGVALGVGIAASAAAAVRFIWVGRVEPRRVRVTATGTGAALSWETSW